MKAQFVSYGLSADFLDDLTDHIAAFEQAVGEKNTANNSQIAATAAIDEQIERGMIAVRRLRAIVPNIYRSNPSKLAAWTSASHVESAAQRKEPSTPAPVNP